MDPGATPVDADDLIQRYARRLLVLAYHLTGDGVRAHELAQECLVRSLLEPAIPTGERETAVHLIRGLISLWKERLEPHARPDRPRGKAEAAAAPVPPAGEHAVLWRALSRLDPTSRAVLVLRVAGDLEYETIGRILDMAADVVYARLLQARSRLRPGGMASANPVFETMNLYLDARLSGAERGEFERQLQSDAALRGQVEFHRGLTLELHEDAPPLPRDFAVRVHDRLDRTRETLALVDQAVEAAGWEPAAGAPMPGASVRRPWWGRAGGVAALVIAVAGMTFWIARRLPVTAPAASSTGAGRPSPSGSPSATPDEATIEALRSLGYLAPARERPARESAPGPGALSWRTVPVGKIPGPGLDYRVIRTAPEWAALFPWASAPEVAFDRDMVVLLPSILVLASVAQTPDALVIECRREPPPAGEDGTGPPAAGQAIILSISDLPIRVVVR